MLGALNASGNAVSYDLCACGDMRTRHTFPRDVTARGDMRPCRTVAADVRTDANVRTRRTAAVHRAIDRDRALT